MVQNRKTSKGVHELVIFQMKPDGPALWGDASKRAAGVPVDLSYVKPIGVLHPEYGATSRDCVLR